ncbi:MAG TPA: hypothetical protein VED84_00395 [Acidimicrobiales bacterium]|nr:hypothetical protein [Acidimicrobiales bacterium]
MNDPRPEARRIADDLVDYAIYAPLGAAIAVAEELPELVRRGRERFGPRLALAQMLGRVAADSAKRRAEAFFRRPASPGATGPAPGPSGEETGPVGSAPRAIPGYETLSAAEVVTRLPGLTRRELLEVRSFEMAHRARRTVLARIAQLLGDEDR